MISCTKGKETISTVSLDMEILPTMHGENISSLISDSGVTRYRLVAKVWDTFTNDTAPYQYFPEGVYLEKFDSLFQVEGYVQADTAYFYEKKDLWRLIGNVHIQNFSGEKFETSELFWNQKAPPSSGNAVYTDSLVRVERAGGMVLLGKGMRSDQSLTYYRFYQPYTDAYFNEEETPVSPVDSTKNSGK
jgi:hypothetical protein